VAREREEDLFSTDVARLVSSPSAVETNRESCRSYVYCPKETDVAAKATAALIYSKRGTGKTALSCSASLPSSASLRAEGKKLTLQAV
jgi:hypothetical protein